MQHNNLNGNNLTFLSPVPINQQPVYQYRNLQEKKFFRWAVLNSSIYAAKLSAVWTVGFLFTLYAITISYRQYNIIIIDLLWGMTFGNIAVIFCLLKLYTVWLCIYSGLIKSKIVYEIPRLRKTTTWQKPQLMMLRDRLIARIQVRPILQRLKQTLLLLCFSLSFLVLLLLTY